MAAILLTATKNVPLPNVQLSLGQVSCLSVEPFFQKVPDKFMGEEKNNKKNNKKRSKNNKSPDTSWSET